MTAAKENDRQAAIWLAREDRGLTAREEQALRAWLAALADHKVAYLRAKSVWQRTDRLAVLRRPVSGTPDEGASERSRVLPWLAAAAAAVILAVGLSVIPRAVNNFRDTHTYATDIGRAQIVKLADGTSIELNTNTRVHTEITGTRRVVVLDNGEAYFDVVHDASRPFTVLAGNHRITDLGTKFSVRRNGNDVRVIVKEGRVRVDDVANPNVASPMVVPQGNAMLTHEGEDLVVPRETQEIEDSLSWRQGMLVFNREALSDVAVEFNRYNDKQIIVQGVAKTIRIGGHFRADNVDVFAQLLHQGFGLTVHDTGNRILVTK